MKIRLEQTKMEPFKAYYTETLLDPTKSFSTLQQHSLQARKSFPNVPELSSAEKKALLLAPLLYRFPQEMEIPSSIQQHARNVLLAVVSSSPPHGDIKSLPSVCTFLEAFTTYLEKDRVALRESLLANLYTLSRFEGTEKETEKLWKHVVQMGWEADYETYEKQQKERALERLSETMDRAFWDMFREMLVRNDTSLLENTFQEIQSLLQDISKRGQDHVQDLFSSVSWKEWTLPQILDWFSRVLHYLQECDAPVMDPVYTQALEDLRILETIPDLVSKGMETLYALVIPLRAKMAVVRDTLGVAV